ncbi:PREDICTED: growth arrest and DNA damage-inducible protein GADD45 alpha [Nipponia nippon]|uniref:growth arrest and DNA damage-inducible protein GADD45 alpha n=1 Tax=Nipponia nippon TaxID=128390 RepID=UPI0005109F54|nr:PREDICTED: growth arrest and DNA damage-inducible protein GADD45 alpha [Nipponia nippon]
MHDLCSEDVPGPRLTRDLAVLPRLLSEGSEAPASQQEWANFALLGPAGTEPEAWGSAWPSKIKHRDPDNVVLCLLAADEEEAGDAALQIHFTLIQAFCCENDINILRVSNPARLAQLLLPAAGPEPPADLHCVLVTNPHASQWKDPALSQLMCFCRESRYMDQWVPVINLPER